MFQNYNLFLNKTAIQNVTEGLMTALKMPRDELFLQPSLEPGKYRGHHQVDEAYPQVEGKDKPPSRM